MTATHYIEQLEDREGVMHMTKIKPISEFNRKLALTKRYGFKTNFLFRITPKPGVLIATHDNESNATIIEDAK